MKKTSVLVLGATGRIGTILRRFWPSGVAAWQARRTPSEAGFLVLDPLGNPGALARAADGCKTILCLAGAIPGRNPDLHDNSRLSEVAIRAADRSKTRVLLASSAAVYGAGAGPLEEETPLAPATEYGRAKAEMEHGAAELGKALGVPVTALRIGNVAGCDAILGGWHPGFALDRFPDGTTPRRSYVGPVTLARVLLDLVRATALPPVLNVAAPGTVAMGDLLDAAGLEWVPRPAPRDAIPDVHLSTTRLEAFSAFDPEDSLPRTLVRQWRSIST